VTLGPDAQHTLDVAVILGHGFIITSMLWAATLSELIDRKMRSAVTYLLIMAGLTLFGFIHSVSPNGDIYLPWTLPEPGKVYVIAASYAVVAVMFALLWTTGRGSRSPEEVAS
jgi:AGZA family xanthine/uracil permease-like MFS transporter